MSDPMPYGTFLKILRAKGLKVIEEYTGGRSPQHHNRNHKGAWGPVNGVMIHHTVTRGHDSTVSICRTGHSTLPGPLCHGVICKRGEVHIVGYGRANHAGLGDDDVLRAVISETALPADNEANTDGNRHFYGFECENLGDGNDPWPEAQLEAIELVSAAICEYHGWSERSVIGHLEWQPGKVDPRGFSMDWMRDQIKEQLAGGGAGGQEEDDMAITRADADLIAQRVWAHMETAGDDDPKRVGALVGWLDRVHNRQDRAVAALASQVGALSATVGRLAEGGGLDAAEIRAAAEAGAQAALAQLGDALKEN